MFLYPKTRIVRIVVNRYCFFVFFLPSVLFSFCFLYDLTFKLPNCTIYDYMLKEWLWYLVWIS